MNVFRGRKPFCEEVKNSGSSQYQLIPGQVSKSDSVNKTTNPHQIHNTDELKFTVQHISDNDEIVYMFYVNEDKLNICPQVLMYL